MTTTYNLNISTNTDDAGSNKGLSQNTNVRTDDPNDMIDLLKKLSGVGSMTSAEPAPSCGCHASAEEHLEEELANAPKTKTMADLLDLIDTGHTPVKNVTNPRPGDNPLVDLQETEKEKTANALAEELTKQWQSFKLSEIAKEFDTTLAEQAIEQGLDSYVSGSNEFAVRTQGNLVKVFPILEDRVMTQVPLYVAETYENLENENSVDAVKSAIVRRIQGQHVDLLKKYGVEQVMAAVDSAARYFGSDPLDEIGSSDVTAYVKYVMSELGEPVTEEAAERGKGKTAKGAVDPLKSKMAETIHTAIDNYAKQNGKYFPGELVDDLLRDSLQPRTGATGAHGARLERIIKHLIGRIEDFGKRKKIDWGQRPERFVPNSNSLQRLTGLDDVRTPGKPGNNPGIVPGGAIGVLPNGGSRRSPDGEYQYLPPRSKYHTLRSELDALKSDHNLNHADPDRLEEDIFDLFGKMKKGYDKSSSNISPMSNLGTKLRGSANRSVIRQRNDGTHKWETEFPVDEPDLIKFNYHKELEESGEFLPPISELSNEDLANYIEKPVEWVEQNREQAEEMASEQSHRVADVNEQSSGTLDSVIEALNKMIDESDETELEETVGVFDYNPPSQGGTREELLKKLAQSKSPEDAEAARKAGATQDELQRAMKSNPVDEAFPADPKSPESDRPAHLRKKERNEQSPLKPWMTGDPDVPAAQRKAQQGEEEVKEGALDDAFPDLGDAAAGLQNLGVKKVDPNSIEVELGPDPYLASATWMDGTPLTPEELAQWQQDHPEMFRQAVQHKSMSKLDEENKQVDEDLNYIKMLLNKWR